MHLIKASIRGIANAPIFAKSPIRPQKALVGDLA